MSCSAINTGGGVALAGDHNVVIPGRGGAAAGPDLAAFLALLEEIRGQVAALPASGLTAQDRADADAALRDAAALAQRAMPPAGRIERALEDAQEILIPGAAPGAGAAAGAAAAPAAVVAQALRMAQSLFR
jgi:hypothetical protein